MVRIKSKGKCVFCGKEYSGSGITKHLEQHLQEKVKDNKHGLSFHIKIGTDPRYDNRPYFLHIRADADAGLKNLDDFLRKIWLECCGHLSSFITPRKLRMASGLSVFEAMELYEKEKTEANKIIIESFEYEIPKSRKLKTVLSKGMKLDYEYDFGSATCLQLTVISELPVKADKKIVLLSRNEPLELLCDICHVNPATKICAVCDGHAHSLFCVDCTVQHKKSCSDFKDYANMPVVNSPRMAVCAYEGGTVDKERDGIFNNRL